MAISLERPNTKLLGDTHRTETLKNITMTPTLGVWQGLFKRGVSSSPRNQINFARLLGPLLANDDTGQLAQQIYDDQ